MLSGSSSIFSLLILFSIKKFCILETAYPLHMEAKRSPLLGSFEVETVSPTSFFAHKCSALVAV